VADNSRIEDLRRRVQRDPASIAFAQLAEEYRRNRQYAESVDTCRAGLALHPGYLSAHVTLGRALIELGELDEAQQELNHVLKNAPENLAAIRGLAEIYHRRGDLSQALAQFQAALALAPNDPEIEETVNELSRQVAPRRRQDPPDGISLEQMQSLFELHGPPPRARPAVAETPLVSALSEPVESVNQEPASPAPDATLSSVERPRVDDAVAAPAPVESSTGTLEPVPAEAVMRADAIETRDATDERSDSEPETSRHIVALARIQTMSLVLVAPSESRSAVDRGAEAAAGEAARAESDGEPSPEHEQTDLEGSGAGARARGLHQIAALEQWLDDIHVTRAK